MLARLPAVRHSDILEVSSLRGGIELEQGAFLPLGLLPAWKNATFATEFSDIVRPHETDVAANHVCSEILPTVDLRLLCHQPRLSGL